MKQLNEYLFKSTSNASLIVFRILFGVLVWAECWGAIATGWVKKTLIEPQFTFSFLNFQWLQPLPENGMYIYFFIMGLCGIAIALGYRYRLAIIIFTVLWAGAYFMQKSSYNNHYYLLVLISFMMCFFNANRRFSLDVKQNRTTLTFTMPNWVRFSFILQIALVYFFATKAKFYPDWLDGTFTKNTLLNAPIHSIAFFKEILYPLFSKEWFYLFIAYAGILFDGLIIPLLCYKKTRIIALIASLIFHLFNAIVLQIGIFPFFALAFILFFYEPEIIEKRFFKNKKTLETSSQKPSKFILTGLVIYFFIQIALPLRHHFIKCDVLWTEEGHRLSWRMMLRSKTGYINIKIRNNNTGQTDIYNLSKNLTNKQRGNLPTSPDFIWQLCQHIKEDYNGQDISIFVEGKKSVNGHKYKTFINPNFDMAKAKWNFFSHNEWILTYPNHTD